jgi:hypothetical protein
MNPLLVSRLSYAMRKHKNLSRLTIPPGLIYVIPVLILKKNSAPLPHPGKKTPIFGEIEKKLGIINSNKKTNRDQDQRKLQMKKIDKI